VSPVAAREMMPKFVAMTAVVVLAATVRKARVVMRRANAKRMRPCPTARGFVLRRDKMTKPLFPSVMERLPAIAMTLA